MDKEEDFITVRDGDTSPAFGRGQAVILGFDFETPSGATGIISLYACRTKGGTYKPVIDPTTGTAVTIPVGISVASWIPAPVHCAYAPFMQLRFANAVTAVMRVYRGA